MPQYFLILDRYSFPKKKEMSSSTFEGTVLPAQHKCIPSLNLILGKDLMTISAYQISIIEIIIENKGYNKYEWAFLNYFLFKNVVLNTTRNLFPILIRLHSICNVYIKVKLTKWRYHTRFKLGSHCTFAILKCITRKSYILFTSSMENGVRTGGGKLPIRAMHW